MARKSRYVAEVKEEKKTAMLLAGVYARLSIEDEDDEEQNSIGNQKKIALDYLGLTADQVQRLRTGYEIDDGIPQYDVEFLEGDWEYEFEIHAETGKILSFDKDHKYD